MGGVKFYGFRVRGELIDIIIISPPPLFRALFIVLLSPSLFFFLCLSHTSLCRPLHPSLSPLYSALSLSLLSLHLSLSLFLHSSVLPFRIAFPSLSLSLPPSLSQSLSLSHSLSFIPLSTSLSLYIYIYIFIYIYIYTYIHTPLPHPCPPEKPGRVDVPGFLPGRLQRDQSRVHDA